MNVIIHGRAFIVREGNILTVREANHPNNDFYSIF